jgi:acetyltransferase-like isoleucine patch superfamily enzyme
VSSTCFGNPQIHNTRNGTAQLAAFKICGQPVGRVKMLVLKILSGLAAQWIRLRGVRLGRRPWILGFPDVKLASGSTIEIGNSASLFSVRWANPLRPARRLSLVTLRNEASIIIGNDVGISSSVISCSSSIRIGDRTLIGADCIVTDTDFHSIPLSHDNPPRTQPVSIGSDVFVGTRCIILKGIEIGDGAVIGAGSVVTVNIPPNSVAAGNPARVIASRRE